MKITLRYGTHFQEVLVDGERLSPQPSLRVFNHSPDGFAWGYGGSGPAQLALAILLKAGLSDDEAARMHQAFKWDFVSRWPHDGPGDEQEHEVDVDAWVKEQRIGMIG